MAGRAEPMFATCTSRTRWWIGQVVVSAAGTLVVTLCGGLGVGVAYGVVVHDAGQVPRMTGASPVTLPAVLVLVGAALAFFGFLPRLVLVAWVVFAGIVVIGLFAETLNLSRWKRNLSPFAHVPQAPATNLTVAPLLVLSAIAAALAVAGWQGFCRRDLGTT